MNKHNIEIPAGATFQLHIVWQDSNDALVNNTGYVARMMVRTDVDTGPIIDIDDAGNAQGGITLGGSDGTIDVSVLASHTTTLTPGSYLWAIELESSDGTVTRLLEGVAVVTEEVVQ